MKTNQQKLRIVLTSNATFSTISGIFLVAFPTLLNHVLETGGTIFYQLLGSGLMLFGLMVFYQAMKKQLSNKAIKLIIWLDWGWALASGILLIGGFFQISFMGQILIASVAAMVSLFAVLQLTYSKT